MVFSSVIFLFYYLPIVLGLYYILPGIKTKNIILLIASLIFYAWGEGDLVFLMIISSLFNYFIALWINKDESRSSKIPITIGITINLLILVYYKYVGLIFGSFDSVFGTHLNDGIHISLPIGISFFTFHSMSYIFDIYKKKTDVQRNPFKMILYISLFPQLVAGPIVRYIEVEKELFFRKHNLENFTLGIKRFSIGLAKKVLIANCLGEIADELFNLAPNEMYFGSSWFAIIAYTLQIYFDFSGYSDMGIGLGKMFGFHFPENFNYPYIANGIQDFWRRWHMTLSRWFRDYVYIPLGGSKQGKNRTIINIAIVFFLTGLWHGATWNFVIWGLFHGFFLIIERLGFGNFIQRYKFFGHTYTIFIVLIGWVLFRIPDFNTALTFYKSMFYLTPIQSNLRLNDFLDNDFIVIFILGIFLTLPIKEYIQNIFQKITNRNIIKSLQTFSIFYYLLLLFLSAISISSSTYNPFIYFRF